MVVCFLLAAAASQLGRQLTKQQGQGGARTGSALLRALLIRYTEKARRWLTGQSIGERESRVIHGPEDGPLALTSHNATTQDAKRPQPSRALHCIFVSFLGFFFRYTPSVCRRRIRRSASAKRLMHSSMAIVGWPWPCFLLFSPLVCSPYFSWSWVKEYDGPQTRRASRPVMMDPLSCWDG